MEDVIRLAIITPPPLNRTRMKYLSIDQILKCLLSYFTNKDNVYQTAILHNVSLKIVFSLSTEVARDIIVAESCHRSTYFCFLNVSLNVVACFPFLRIEKNLL